MISENIWIVISIFVVIALLAAYTINRIQSKKRKGNETFLKGLLALIEGDLDNALRYLHTAALNDTQNITAFILVGDILRQKGQAKKAIGVHLPLLSRSDLSKIGRIRILKSLALDFYKENVYSRAREYIEKAIVGKPDNWSYRMLLNILEKEKDWKTAISILSKTKTDNSEELLAIYNVELGKSYAEKENYNKAQGWFKVALKHKDDFIPAMLSMGDSYLAIGKHSEAIEWWINLIEKYPEKGYLVSNRIETAYYNLGEFDKVRDTYEKLLKRYRHAEYLRISLSSIYEKMGELEKALEILNEAPEKTDNIYLVAAKLEFLLNDTDAATTDLELFIQNYYKNVYKCSECGYETKEPLSLCPNCGEINTFDL